MNRFLSKLDLRDIKIDPRGSRFPPDADDAPTEEEGSALPDLRQAQADEAEAVVRGEDWEMGHDPSQRIALTGTADEDDADDRGDAAPADQEDAAPVMDVDTMSPSAHRWHAAGDPADVPPADMMGASGTPSPINPALGSPPDDPALPSFPARPTDHWQRGGSATGDARVRMSPSPGIRDHAPDPSNDDHDLAAARDTDLGPVGGFGDDVAGGGKDSPRSGGDIGTGDGGSYAATAEVLKVSARSRPSAVAGAIAGVVRELGRAEVQAIGAGATNQAIKAVAIARDYLQENGIEAVCLPAFIDVTIENEDRTAMLLVIEPR